MWYFVLLNSIYRPLMHMRSEDKWNVKCHECIWLGIRYRKCVSNRDGIINQFKNKTINCTAYMKEIIRLKWRRYNLENTIKKNIMYDMRWYATWIFVCVGIWWKHVCNVEGSNYVSSVLFCIDLRSLKICWIQVISVLVKPSPSYVICYPLRLVRGLH